MGRVLWIFLVIVTWVWTGGAIAEPPVGRVGVGFRDPWAYGLPSLSFNYYMPRLAWGMAMGVRTLANQSALGLEARLTHVVGVEERVFFYVGGSLGWTHYDSGTAPNISSQSAVQLGGLFGAEFFPLDSQNLSLFMEAGVLSLAHFGGQVDFMTFGKSPLLAGMLYYF